MKGILEFNLPEENDDFKKAVFANEMSLVFWELDQWLRSNTKYAPDSMSADTYNAYQDCRDKLTALLNEYNVNFD
jgi:hypothetical protein